MKLSSLSVISGLTLGVTTLLIACGAEKAPHSTNANQASAAISATAQSIQISAKDVGNRAMDWQLARMDNFEDYIVKMNHTAEPRNWVQGAFYIGLTQWTEATDSQTGLGALTAVSRSNQYELGDRHFHADDHAIGQTYLWLYERTGDEAFYGPTKKIFDEILAFNPTNSLQLIEKSHPDYEGSCQKTLVLVRCLIYGTPYLVDAW